jgi:hypothetical protein
MNIKALAIKDYLVPTSSPLHPYLDLVLGEVFSGEKIHKILS